MSTEKTLSDAAEKAMADHEMMVAFIQSFRMMSGVRSSQARQEAIDAARRFLNSTLPAHFAFEEHQLFPALLYAPESRSEIDQIFLLRAEHRLLLRDAKLLDLLLSDHAAPPSKLRRAMGGFFRCLKDHAAQENTLFPSLV